MTRILLGVTTGFIAGILMSILLILVFIPDLAMAVFGVALVVGAGDLVAYLVIRQLREKPHRLE